MSADDIYQQAILELANAANARGTLASPDARATLDNPLCGDCVEIQINVRDDRITALAHDVQGCLLCRAAASVIGKRAIGATLSDIEAIGAAVSAMLEEQALPPSGWDELSAFKPVHGHRSRYRCVQLPFEALASALRSSSA
ncbi:MAG TPA: iron-sulfur cluster assembly scaffold protein [Burkholderiales bacterium]|nr:iron-sulfur cluster assembly scaffold protein [Burkholderiales bacterium]